jgi:hypothetical protein
MKTRLRAPVICVAALLVFAAQGGPMARSETPDIGTQDHLDRRFPFIERDQQPPGRYVPSGRPGGMLKWQGQSGWRTRHGRAVVMWHRGKPMKVEDALYPDGSRGEARDTLDHGFRRRASGDRLWIYGRVDVQPDDVSFIDGDQPIYQPPPQSEVPDLEADLARDSAFLAALKDDRFALAVLKVIENHDFYKGQDTRSWGCGSSGAASLVANLRGLGESYHDHDPRYAVLAGTYPDDRPDIERRLQLRIDRLSKALTMDPPLAVRAEDLLAWLGPGAHSADEIRRATELMRPQLEKRRSADMDQYREQQRAALEEAQRELATFREDRANDDVLEALRAHLSRLGWRTETEQDRAQARQQWVARALRVLREVKELEQRSASPPGPWVKFLRRRDRVVLHRREPGALESMSADKRAVETGELEARLRTLALTGRITEQEYRTLSERLSHAIANGGVAEVKTPGSTGDAERAQAADQSIPRPDPIDHR